MNKKLLEILTVCIAWETDEILEDCTKEIKEAYFESLERIKPLVRDFIYENFELWDKNSRHFIFVSYVTILGDKRYGKYLISCPDEAEVYCTECGYEWIMNFDEQIEYDINKVDCFSKKDYDSLELNEKVDIAYELADSKNKEHSALAAKYFFKLYNEIGKLYYYCIYTNMLYKSGDREKALEEYDKILAFPKDTILENREYFTRAIYSNKLDYYKEDKDMFRKMWDEAKANYYIQQNNHFPMAYISIIQVLEVSFNYEFYDICEEMIEIAKKEKLAIPSKIKEYYKDYNY